MDSINMRIHPHELDLHTVIVRQAQNEGPTNDALHWAWQSNLVPRLLNLDGDSRGAYSHARAIAVRRRTIEGSST